MHDLPHDLRSALRGLYRRPASGAVSVLVLALGIAASTALFTEVNAFYQPIPGAADSDRLVHVRTLREDGSSGGLSYPDFLDYAAASSHVDLAATGLFGGGLRDTTGTDWFWGRLVSADFFSVLDVEMSVGNPLTAADGQPGADGACVLSYRFWRRRFGGDESVVGRVVHLDGRPFTVRGVAAPEFRTVYAGFHPDLWLPIRQLSLLRPESWTRYESRPWPAVGVVGRLRPGVGLAAAQAELDALASRLDQSYPRPTARRLHLSPARRFIDRARAANLPAAWRMLGAAGLLLLLACANVANVLSAVALGRRREMAVRAAIGAEPRRLLRLLLVENVVLGLAAGGLALVLLRPAIAGLTTFQEPSGVFAFGAAPVLTVDFRVFGFALAVSIAAGLLAALLPAVAASRRDLVTSLKETGDTIGGRRYGSRELMISLQVALSVALLALAGLFLRGFDSARQREPGFDTERLLAAATSVRGKGLSRDQANEYFRRLAERIDAEPGVAAASVTGGVPLAESASRRWQELRVDGRGDPVPFAMTTVGPRFLETLGIELRQGRGLDVRDSADAAGAVLVNETLAGRFFDGAALGRRFYLPGRDGEPDRAFEIVGVVADTRYHDLLEEPEPLVFFSMFQHDAGSSMTVLVRTEAAAAAIVPGLHDKLRRLDPDLAVVNVSPYSAIVRDHLSELRRDAELFSTLAALGLALAAAGVWSVVNLAVSRRRREMGIRMALGARRGDIVVHVLRRGLLAVGVGVGLGVPAAWGAARIVRGLLYGVEASDPFAFLAAVVVMATAAAFAGYLPARRAAGVDPVVSLREE